jgi:hypothetical protein
MVRNICEEALRNRVQPRWGGCLPDASIIAIQVEGPQSDGRFRVGA